MNSICSNLSVCYNKFSISSNLGNEKLFGILQTINEYYYILANLTRSLSLYLSKWFSNTPQTSKDSLADFLNSTVITSEFCPFSGHISCMSYKPEIQAFCSFLHHGDWVAWLYNTFLHL